MNFQQQLSSVLTAILVCGPITTLAQAQQAAVPAPVVAAASPAITEAELLKKTQPLSEEELRTRYVGKLIFLRGSYLGDNLDFDKEGKITGAPAVSSFTLSAFEVRKIDLSKHKLDIEADRYGLHFLGALPFEDDSKTYDRVQISKKPVHISIDRELIVIPKVKKEKKKKKQEPSAAELAAAQKLKLRDAAAPPSGTETASVETPKAAPTAAAAAETAEALAAVSPAHSAMVMNKALDTIFANDLDPQMMSHLPDYWQEYYTSKKLHRAFVPADPNVRVLSEGMMPPKVLNRIDPSSNEFAQQFGIAGMEQLRTVVDATGVPRQIAIARPIGFGLDEQAVEAVRKSRFKPATLNGQAVPVVIDLVVTFRIYSNRTQPGSVTNDSKEAVMAASAAESSATPDANLPR
jgi:TonB family protein